MKRPSKSAHDRTMDLIDCIYAKARSLENQACKLLERAATHRAMANQLLRAECTRPERKKK
jgi:hypothetical protein